jgi:hypothetical protein
MNRKNFSLKDIQQLSDHYSQAGIPEPVALFQIIQGYYPSGQTPDFVSPVPFETLIGKIKASSNSPSLPEQTDDQKSWLNSVREKLNSELFALMSERGNRASLSLDSDFTFIQFEGTTKMGLTVQHRKFKESEITFNLPEELKAEFENQLQRLKDKEELANQQMKEILEKEKILLENKVAMKKEISEAFQVEKEKGQIKIVSEQDEKKPLEYDDAIAKAWVLLPQVNKMSTSPNIFTSSAKNGTSRSRFPTEYF